MYYKAYHLTTQKEKVLIGSANSLTSACALVENAGDEHPVFIIFEHSRGGTPPLGYTLGCTRDFGKHKKFTLLVSAMCHIPVDPFEDPLFWEKNLPFLHPENPTISGTTPSTTWPTLERLALHNLGCETYVKNKKYVIRKGSLIGFGDNMQEAFDDFLKTSRIPDSKKRSKHT